MFINRISRSLAFRLPVLYQFLLKNKRLTSQAKENYPLVTLVTMAGKSHIDLLRFSVWSIARSWSRLPTLIIYNDGSIKNEQLKQKLNFWPGKLSIWDWEESSVYHQQLNRKALVNYAKLAPFGKKLSIILHRAETKNVIWFDSDILFFNDFIPFLPTNTYSSITCGGSEDWITAYDDRIIKQFPELRSFSNFNAGLLYVRGQNIYEKYRLEDILNEIHPNYDFFTEQTIFAKIARDSLGKVWDRAILKNFNDDKQDIKPMRIRDVIARHYTSNVRHLFWRDLFAFYR